MTSRLESKHPHLARCVRSLPEDALKRVVGIAGTIAVGNARLEPALAAAVIVAFEQGTRVEPDVREHLVILQEQLDGSYLDVLDSLRAGQELPAQAALMFHRARALAAVLQALEMPSDVEAGEVVYEAIASDPDEAKIVSALLRACES